MAFVPLAALGALAATTTALYQKAKIEKPRTSFEIPTRTSPSTPLPSRDLMAKKNEKGGSARSVRKGTQPRFRSTRVISAPATRGGVTTMRVPRLLNTPGSLSVRHCEPFQTVGLSAAGALLYGRTALIPAVMPYLSGIASNFGKWTWTSLRIYYVPSCPTSTEGEVAMGLTYDRQDAIAASFVQTASFANSVSFPPWGGGEARKDISIVVDCSRFDKPRYSYMNSPAFVLLGSSDQNNYCPVTLAQATQGSLTAVVTAGRLWAEYTVHLLDPIPSGINV